MMISFMFHNVKQLFQTLKQEFNNNKKVALPWDISKMKNDSKRQGFECLSWDNILFYIHTYCLQYERVHFEYLLEIKIFIFFCPMVMDFTNLTRFTHHIKVNTWETRHGFALGTRCATAVVSYKYMKRHNPNIQYRWQKPIVL